MTDPKSRNSYVEKWRLRVWSSLHELEQFPLHRMGIYDEDSTWHRMGVFDEDSTWLCVFLQCLEFLTSMFALTLK